MFSDEIKENGCQVNQSWIGWREDDWKEMKGVWIKSSDTLLSWMVEKTEEDQRHVLKNFHHYCFLLSKTVVKPRHISIELMELE